MSKTLCNVHEPSSNCFKSLNVYLRDQIRAGFGEHLTTAVTVMEELKSLMSMLQKDEDIIALCGQFGQ